MSAASSRHKRRSRFLSWLPFAIALAITVASLVVGRLHLLDRGRAKMPLLQPGETLVTGYCNCGRCCGWKRNFFGFGEPVYDYGAMKGRPKRVGVTASGKRAGKGTIAADPKVYPFGTHLYVPGYGYGTVEDVGGSIKGRHIDVWFPTHSEARKWGSRRLKVRNCDRPPATR